jgi:hypothetical protein
MAKERPPNLGPAGLFPLDEADDRSHHQDRSAACRGLGLPRGLARCHWSEGYGARLGADVRQIVSEEDPSRSDITTQQSLVLN